MGMFTVIPVWIIQDILVIAASVMLVMFIIRTEKRPVPVLLEMFFFTFLYAAVYENFATLMGWYGYGRSLLMVFNVPVTVPLVEYLVVYTSIRLFEKAGMPVWVIPVLVGFSGMLFDFSLDPVATSQVFPTLERTVGRWSWYPGPGDVNIFGIPVYNFSGWFILCGYAAVTILLGRWWYRKSRNHPVVGTLYPALAMIAALLLIVSPLSQFLLWLAPIFRKGSAGEWIMISLMGGVSIALLAVFFRKRPVARIRFRSDYPIFLVLIGFHLSDIIFAIVGGYYRVLWLQVPMAAAQTALVILLARRSQKPKAAR